ncbi:MAG: type I 3-dehydroquinate dehydratase [Acutalibacteraceae bacterium]
MNPLLVRSCAFGTGHEKICVPLTAPDTPSLRQQAKAAIHAGCDLVEWRVDAMKDGLAIDVMRPALRALREEVGEKPILFTFRTKEEGGLAPAAWEAYEALYRAAVEEPDGADLFDVELNRGEERVTKLARDIQEKSGWVVMSYHDFHKTPEQTEIQAIFRRMAEKGADIGKVAVMPQTKRDVLTLMQASAWASEMYKDRLFIAISMGPLGMLSRLSGYLTGSCLTFGTAGRSSAPGQPPAGALRAALSLLPGEEIEP